MIPAVWAGFLCNATVLVTVTEIKGVCYFFMKDLSYITDFLKLFAVLNGIASVRFPYREPTNMKVIEEILKNFKNIEAGNRDDRWKSYSIVKKKNGKFRIIFEPKIRTKIHLECIKMLLESVYKPKSYVTAFTKGRSIVNNAQIHTGSKWIYNIDLKDFFHSFTPDMLTRALMGFPFNMNYDAAEFIANYSCNHNAKYGKRGKISLGTILPQGSPASPILSNIACTNLDNQLLALAQQFNYTYSRYADDITFGGGEDISQNLEFINHLNAIIQKEGFAVNRTKTRCQRYTRRQIVTGLVANKNVSIKRNYIKETRSLIHIWRKYGIDEVVERYSKRHGTVTNKRFKIIIAGKINYIRMVMGTRNNTVNTLYTAYKECLKNKR